MTEPPASDTGGPPPSAGRSPVPSTTRPPEEPDGDELRTSLADRRTSLAGERTLLAWWRTGLAALAVALAVGRVLPVLAPNATRWPYVVLGSGFALYGIVMFLLGTQRLREHPAEDRTLVVLMGVGAILGIGTLAVILAQ